MVVHFGACHPDASFKLPLRKSIKHMQALKETFHLYESILNVTR